MVIDRRAPCIRDVSHLSTGYFKVAAIPINTAYKTFEAQNTRYWNPVLLMIGLNQRNALE